MIDLEKSLIDLIQTMTNKIADQLQSALQSIALAAQMANRTTTDIKLLAVSKTKPDTMIEAAWQAGQRSFGENYVQEGLQKIANLGHLTDTKWHLIGPLQSNKCKAVAENFDWVQSVDRLKIAKRLNNNRPQNKPQLNVCVQVNISGEASKSGIMPGDIKALCDGITEMPNLVLRGIMAIPSKTEDANHLKEEFKQLKDIYDELTANYEHIDTLSMGMSADLGLAIRYGSTMVRIGTAIFGRRELSGSL